MGWSFKSNQKQSKWENTANSVNFQRLSMGLDTAAGTHRLYRHRKKGRIYSRLSRIVLETSLSQKQRETVSTLVVKAVRHLEM